MRNPREEVVVVATGLPTRERVPPPVAAGIIRTFRIGLRREAGPTVVVGALMPRLGSAIGDRGVQASKS
ncbi:MAG: hypothetical protein WAL04_00135, partial [Acidimicrobiales bacterium]